MSEAAPVTARLESEKSPGQMPGLRVADRQFSIAARLAFLAAATSRSITARQPGLTCARL